MDRELLRKPRRVIPEREPDGRFKPGHSGGRTPGQPNRINRTLRECILMAGRSSALTAAAATA